MRPATAADLLGGLSGVPPLGSVEAFFSMLREKHPEHAEALIREVNADAARRRVTAVYGAKNATLSLSLDATMAFMGDRLLAWLRWLMDDFAPRLARRPHRVLDLGCDNGLLTCFYAGTWPDAEVI